MVLSIKRFNCLHVEHQPATTTTHDDERFRDDAAEDIYLPTKLPSLLSSSKTHEDE